MNPQRRLGRAVGAVVFVLGAGVGVFSCSAEAPPGGAGGTGGGTLAGGSSGSSATGGSGNAGGSVSSGSGGSGAGVASGGSTSSGGSNSSGGSTNTGGSTSSGGSTSTGGSGGEACTDTPPPNNESCANAVMWGWCGQDWMNGACAASCGMCTGGSGGSGGSGNVQQPPPITSGGRNGWLSRYWDCCKPACGWSDKGGGAPAKSCGAQNQSVGNDTQSACANGGAYACWDDAPWAVSDTLAYGFAAVGASSDMFVCGRCYQLDFTGSADSGDAGPLKGKTMIVQVINNGQDVNHEQIDVLIPGGGVGQFNACSSQWGVSNSELGAQYGGFRTACGNDKGCVRDMCENAFGDKPALMAGCDWFLNWYNNVDNPDVVFKQIACPTALTQRSGMHDPG